nr:GAF domain-containing SpoIIE family protein phosphatase [Kineosporia mesophila]
MTASRSVVERGGWLSLDRYTQLVRDVLNTPAAIVSILTEHAQTLPGASGLPEPWQSQRWTPLVYSVCLLVVEGGVPVAVPDARLDERTSHSPSIEELDLVAYLGVPLSRGGRIVGALCAVDSEPRAWSDRDIHLLTGLGAACSAELDLRDSQAQARSRQEEAETARAAAESDGDSARAAQKLSELRTAASERADRQSRLLLSLSEALTATTTVDSVIRVVQEAAITYLDAESADFDLAGSEVLLDRDGDGAGRTVHVPLSGSLPGRLALTWASRVDARNVAEAAEQPESDVVEIVTALSHYASTALDRAILLQERRSAAATLQHAMLTTLPTRADLELAARYVPAASSNQVGGDWYDAVAMPTEDDEGPENLAVVIGDVAGHDIDAAATMGQVRSVLRGLLVDSPRPPAEMITRLDRALTRLGLATCSTLVLAMLHRHPGEPTAGRLAWASAGHPQPVLIRADGTTELLAGAPDLLLGIPLDLPRQTRRAELNRGDTLILYTDGLIQRPGRTLAEGQRRLMASAAEHRGLPLKEALDRVLQDLISKAPDDDCAVLGLRLV